MNSDEWKVAALLGFAGLAVMMAVAINVTQDESNDPYQQILAAQARQLPIDVKACEDTMRIRWPQHEFTTSGTQQLSGGGVHVMLDGKDQWHGTCMTAFDNTIRSVSVRRSFERSH